MARLIRQQTDDERGSVQARAIAGYMFRLHGDVQGARSLEQIDAMKARELRAFAHANHDRDGAAAMLAALGPDRINIRR